jgi:hypothetical protein
VAAHFRHGLRVAELCDLRWEQVEFNAAVLHVRRVKNGTPRTHPFLGDEMRAVRRLQRESSDLRPLALGERKAYLARLLARRPPGIEFNEHTDVEGILVFEQACKMEGIVSKRLTAPYRSGPSRDWIKVKNPDSPAMMRHREGRWEK